MFSPQTVVRFIVAQRALLVLVILCAVLGLLLPPFLTTRNILNVLRQISITGIVAVGMTFVIVTGGIDISVGSIVALCGVVTAAALQAELGLVVAILAGLMVGGIVGLINGLLVSYGRVMPFVATLGTMYLFRGISLIVTGGQAIWNLTRTPSSRSGPATSWASRSRSSSRS